MAKFKDITGKTFGRLTALEKIGRTNKYEAIWKTCCTCGNFRNVNISKLTSGKTKSCGCLSLELLLSRSVIHNKTGTPEHNSWMYMNQRCSSSDPNKSTYYGDIEVQNEWKADFISFLEHIGEQPKDGSKYTIDRIDNTKGYIKGNVRWATMTQQARNKGLQIKSKTRKNGVTLQITRRYGKEHLRYIASWYSLDGKLQNKSFSVFKYGLLPAFCLACSYRDKMIYDLNKQGAGYSANHGK